MEDRLPRKLAAILYADVAGYSRLTGEDEDTTHRTLSEYLDLAAETITTNRGQVMHYAGDAVLAQFAAVVDALSAAETLQRELATRNANLPERRRVKFRIGINLGDVIEDRGDIYGDGVNVAARLETLAEPGSICVSAAVRTAISKTLPLRFEFIGEHMVKNIAEPVRAYRVFSSGNGPARGSKLPGAETTSAKTPLGKPSLAVKPFIYSSGDPGQSHFADGLTNGIIVALTKMPALTIIQDESPSYQSSKEMSAQELGERFQARYVLKGTVRTHGPRLRVNAELLETSTGRYLFAEQFDREVRELSDFFDLQDDITEEIVASMAVKLDAGEVSRLLRKTFSNSAALECYYRGEDLLWRATTKPELHEARRLLEEVVRLEPESPTGYATAALSYWLEALSNPGEALSGTLTRAMELAREAIARDDLTGYAHMIIAHTHLHQRDYVQAMREASKAVTDRPSCPGAYSLKASVLIYLGNPSEALELAQYATRLSPVRPPDFPAVLPTAYFFLRRYEEAVAAARAAIDLDPRSPDLWVILAASCAALGDGDEAHRAVTEVLRLKPGFTLDAFASSEPYQDPALLDDLLSRLRAAGLQ